MLIELATEVLTEQLEEQSDGQVNLASKAAREHIVEQFRQRLEAKLRERISGLGAMKAGGIRAKE